jgi:glucose-6-phosphate 1-epimerase
MEPNATIADLNRRFAIPGIAQIIPGHGGLPKVQITAPTSTGEIYLHGAHVTSWRPSAAEEVLFLSSKSRYQEGAAIRGGVPICFPWFGNKSDDPKAPAHGFVRTKSWQLDAIAQEGGAVVVTMSTASDETTKSWWPADFRLLYRATFGPKLTLELSLTNTGSSPLRFEEALHSYLQVGDCQQASLQGLSGVHYIDKTDSSRVKDQQGDITITSETDRVYLNTHHPIDLPDPILHRHIRVEKLHSLATVIWNPWLQKAQSFSDLGPNEWKQMICIETCNVAEFAVIVAPGQQHKMTAIISLAPL